MDISRRHVGLLLPLLAARASADEKPADLISTIYHPDQTTDLGGKPKKGSRIFFGADHSGFQIEMHETVLGPRVQSHDPHRHIHEEMMVVLDGAVQTFVDGMRGRAEKGDVIYFASNQLHNVSNAGTIPCRYYVLELRGHTS